MHRIDSMYLSNNSNQTMHVLYLIVVSHEAHNCRPPTLPVTVEDYIPMCLNCTPWNYAQLTITSIVQLIVIKTINNDS